MAQTQIADVIVPAEFTAYQVENSLVSTALFQSGVAVRNGEMVSQLQAGAESFSVPFWADAGEKTHSNAGVRKMNRYRKPLKSDAKLSVMRSIH
jgi:hypothetical protein